MNHPMRLATLLLAGAILFSCNGEEKAPAAPAKGPAVKTPEPPAEPEVPAVKPPEPPAEPAPPAKNVVEEAKALLADATKMIQNKDFAGAKGLLTKLGGMKDQLPADLQKQIDDALTALKAKEALGGLGIK